MWASAVVDSCVIFSKALLEQLAELTHRTKSSKISTGLASPRSEVILQIRTTP